VLAPGGPGSQVAPEAPAGEDDPVRVDLGEGEHVVDHRAHHALPVRAHGQPVAHERPALPGSVEAEEVVAALERRRAVGEEALVDRRVEAVDVHDRGSPSAVVRRHREVGGQRRPLERDLELARRRVDQRGARDEGRRLALGRLAQPRVHGPPEQGPVRGAPVRARAQVGVARARLVAAPGRFVRDRLDPLGGGGLLAVPVVTEPSGPTRSTVATHSPTSATR
jgi:hypothetical protein